MTAISRKVMTRKKPAKKAPAKRASTAHSPQVESARQMWRMGDWAGLASLADVMPTDLAKADRLVVQLLVASGLAQHGRPRAAGLLLTHALEDGLDRELAARILIAGVHSTLGRAALHIADNVRAQRAFATAADFVVRATQADQTASALEVAARTAMGDMLGARDTLTARFAALAAAPQIRSEDALILSSQIEILQHEMALMLQRGQMAKAGAAPAAEQSMAQLGQDLWVIEQSGHKRGGFFVEFGATDGIALSNTYLLETDYGWNGLCSEPNPGFFKELEKNRRCTVTRDCILGCTGEEVTFILADVYGGVVDYADVDAHSDKRRAYEAKGKSVKLKTISLDDYLNRYDAPHQIDYISIDTEGSEYEILRNFPFDSWDVEMFTIEHNFTPQRAQIRDLMEGHGYRCVEKEWDDWFTRDSAVIVPKSN